jgi:arsenate reductase
MVERGMHNVLFLGGGNAARSIMAEAILNRDGAGNFRAYSAGVQSAPELDRHAVNLLTRSQFDMAGMRPKDWSELTGNEAPAFDFVFTMCDHAALLPQSVWKGEPFFAHWDIDDPAQAEGSMSEIELAYAVAFRMLSKRISIFVNLPLRSLDAMAMQSHLDLIGDRADQAATVAA